MKNWDWTNRFEVFLFDFDGLLVDTEKLHFESFCTLCSEENYHIPWNFETYCQIAHLNEKALREHTWALFPQLKEKFPVWGDFYGRKKKIYLNLLSSAPLECFPGVPEFLTHLSRLQKKMAVATNSSLSSILKAQGRLPVLELIPVWITREDYEHPKPFPDPYLKALEVLSAGGAPAVGFEDTTRGITSLKRAGVQAVLVNREFHLDKKHPDLIDVPHFKNFEEINL